MNNHDKMKKRKPEEIRSLAKQISLFLTAYAHQDLEYQFYFEIEKQLKLYEEQLKQVNKWIAALYELHRYFVKQIDVIEYKIDNDLPPWD